MCFATGHQMQLHSKKAGRLHCVSPTVQLFHLARAGLTNSTQTQLAWVLAWVLAWWVLAWWA
jgi:hypothetical protein